MLKKFFVRLGFICFAFGIAILALNINFSNIATLPEDAIVSFSDIEDINKQDIFGKFVNANLTDLKVGSDKNTYGKMWLKLFGVIPIKQIDVEIGKGEEVYLGGIPLGFAIKTKGLLVVGNNSVLAENGSRETSKSGEIKNGDIILKINNISIDGFEQIPQILEENNGEAVSLTILRNGEEITCKIVPELDGQSGEYKIGLWVKDDANGIGTLTFVKIENNRFGALGHPITDYETGVEIPIQDGKIYKCSLVGINKAEKNSPGELRCIFLQGVNTKGSIEKNTKYGVYGEITDLKSVVDYNLTAEIGSRLGVKTGKAFLVSSVSGVREEYEIEIIKASYQPKSDDKSFVFRVVDARLLKLTGGILQGMSGSPIVQNDKLIGAVTHVFVSDPTKGYGIYADWMSKM